MAGRTEIRLEGTATSPAEPRLEIVQQPVLDLSHELAVDSTFAGAKAASLAAAGRLGLPVLPGFVVTTSTVQNLLEAGRLEGPDEAHLRKAWNELAQGGSRSLIVRSSSVAEDGSTSSMAGMFTSVTDVMGFEKFMDALKAVAHSSKLPGKSDQKPAPMGVLVQPYLGAKLGGILFGIDPITGAADRLVIAAVEGAPEHLVSGRVQGNRYVVRKNGRIVDVEASAGGAPLGGTRRRSLAQLAVQAERAFGSPQDIEWAIDISGRLWLLQTRPITAKEQMATGVGPVLGPGPVAETFPGQLSVLEEELWVEPLKVALKEALLLVRGASRKRIENSPIVVTVGGRVAADLELLGDATKRSFLQRLDPRPPARRLRASWDVGRLRKAFPSLAERLLQTVDYELTKIPPLSEITDIGLVDLLKRSQQTLIALNGHEVLAGMLMRRDATAQTGASLGLRALNEGRAAGLDDATIVSRRPEVLALRPPAIGRKVTLPEISVAPPASDEAADPLAETREMCRLRARWIYELTSRAGEELGRRFSRGEVLQDASDIRLLRIAEIEEMILSDIFPPELDRRGVTPLTPPLPAAFRLSEDGRIVQEETTEESDGRGAGGGRGKGRVVHDPTVAQSGDVLVVETLNPDLAPVLPGLGGLIAETGSILSHLAILAREFGVPTVVGVTSAISRFPEGSILVLDGTSGDINILEEIEGQS